jgi:hypothetical protein
MDSRAPGSSSTNLQTVRDNTIFPRLAGSTSNGVDDSENDWEVPITISGAQDSGTQLTKVTHG